MASVLVACGGSSSTQAVSKVLVIPSVSSVSINGKQTYTANAVDKDGNAVSATFTWSSSAPAVATIDSNGLAVGKSAGSTKITATTDNVTSAAVDLTVLPSVASVELSPLSATIRVGEKQQFTATAKDASGKTIEGAVIAWAVSSSVIATMDKNGQATGISAGTVQVTASTGGISSQIANLNITN
jgi:uncharacterized protein YjdB